MTMRVEIIFTVAIIILSFTAEKCRQLVGEELSSRSWTDRFTFLNCFDMKYGTIMCIAKECIKLYLYYIRAIHVHKVRAEATKEAMKKELSKDSQQCIEASVKRARDAGNVAARRALRQMGHVVGPVLSAGWDLFEALYVGGTLSEGITRAVGTFVGAYIGGIIGEGKIGWFGFLVGSQLGSWFGGRLGLMVYDVGKGVKYLMQINRR